MTWHQGALAPFDLESTGVNIETDRIVTGTVAHVVPGSEPLVTEHLIAVDVEIPAAATEVHGITTEYAREHGKPAAEVLEALAAHLADLMADNVPIVGMNLCFDFSLLDRELRRHNLPALDDRLGREIGPIVDILVLDKAVDQYRPGKRQLTHLCEHYGVRLDGAHDATADALAAARVAYKIGYRAAGAITDPTEVLALYSDRRYPENVLSAFRAVGRMSMAELHVAQRGWYKKQSEGLVQFWRKKAAEDRVRTLNAQSMVIAALAKQVNLAYAVVGDRS